MSTPVQGVPFEPTPQPQPPAPSGPVSMQRLQMPIGWVASVVAAVLGGALSLGAIYWRAEAHATDAAKHLGPEVAQQGGVVTAARLRRVLRKMEINCRPANLGGGFACGVTLPEEAE